MPTSPRLILLSLLVVACQAPGSPEGSTSVSDSTESEGTTSLGGSGMQLTGTGMTTGTGAPTGSDSGVSPSGSSADGATTIDPPVLDLGAVPDVPSNTPEPCEKGCLPDEYCEWCEPFAGRESCEPFPVECAATPTCECLVAVLGESCFTTPEGLIVFEPFCEGPKG